MTPELCLIAAIAGENRVIGNEGRIPWPRFKEDMNNFQKVTDKHPVVMGRKTWDSLDAKHKPLSGRLNIVVSRSSFMEDVPPNIYVFSRLDNAIDTGRRLDTGRVFIIGGGEIYRQTIDRADRLFLTLVEPPVEGDYEGDTFFPDYSEFKNVVKEEEYQSVKGVKYKIVELTK